MKTFTKNEILSWNPCRFNNDKEMSKLFRARLCGDDEAPSNYLNVATDMLALEDKLWVILRPQVLYQNQMAEVYEWIWENIVKNLLNTTNTDAEKRVQQNIDFIKCNISRDEYKIIVRNEHYKTKNIRYRDIDDLELAAEDPNRVRYIEWAYYNIAYKDCTHVDYLRSCVNRAADAEASKTTVYKTQEWYKIVAEVKNRFLTDCILQLKNI